MDLYSPNANINTGLLKADAITNFHSDTLVANAISDTVKNNFGTFMLVILKDVVVF